MHSHSKQYLPIVLVMTLTACGTLTSIPPSQSLAQTPSCSEDYANKRNKLVEDLDIGFLDFNLSQYFMNNDISPSLHVNEAAAKEKLAALRDEMKTFLDANRNQVCTGLVLKCKPEYTKDTNCFLDPSESDWVNETVTNDSLQANYETLVNFLKANP